MKRGPLPALYILSSPGANRTFACSDWQDANKSAANSNIVLVANEHSAAKAAILIVYWRNKQK